MRQVFVPGRIDGIEASGPAPAPTSALLGRRVLWVYSTEHAYEHVYLTPTWYSWHCLAGPERGLADTDENTAYEVRPGIYVFAWREKVIPCASVTIADHRSDAFARRAVRARRVRHGADPLHLRGARATAERHRAPRRVRPRSLTRLIR